MKHRRPPVTYRDLKAWLSLLKEDQLDQTVTMLVAAACLVMGVTKQQTLVGACEVIEEYNRDLRMRIRDGQVGSGMKHR